jgi:integrase
LAKIELRTNYENNFEAIGREWHSQKAHTWKPDHAETILKRLEVNIFRKIGTRPIKEIKTVELLDAIRVLENDGKRDLAHRMLQHCGQIMRYAVATGRADHDLTINLKGALQPVQSKHYTHLIESELPAFLKKLNRYDVDYGGNTLTRLAFQFLILTFVRSGEIRGAKWEEIDFDKAQWRIPAERMKMKDPHIVPLCTQSIEILKEPRPITGHYPHGFMFLSLNSISLCYHHAMFTAFSLFKCPAMWRCENAIT